MNFKNLVWAIDYGSKKSNVNKSVASFLKVFTNIKTAKIHPVSVLSLGKLGFIEDLSRNEVLEYKEDTISETYEIMKKVGFGHLTPELVSVKGRKTADMIKGLNKHVTKVKGDMIVLGSHNYNALDRFFLGSFTESLIFSSKTPTLVVNPKMSPMRGKLSRILFPLDLREDYQQEVSQCLKFAKSYGVKEIHFFHYFGLGRGTTRQPQYIRDNLYNKTQTLEKIVASTKKKGFTCRYHIQLEEKNVTDSLLAAAKKSKAQMIMMKGKTEKIQAIFVGSVTRNVVRYSTIPVLVLH